MILFAITIIALLLFVVHGELHEIRLYESVDLAVHHSVHIRGLVVGAVVFHTTVIKDITSYLASPLYLLLSCLNLRLCLETLLHGTVVELRLEQSHGVVAVFEL